MAEDPLHLLCTEPGFPGRLGAVADWLVRRRGYHCQFYCAAAEPLPHWPPATGYGLDVIQFNVGGVARQPAVSWERSLERGLCHAYGCWEVLDARRPRGIDLVVGRSAGLGSTLFAPVCFPGVPIMNLFDYFHSAHEHDLAEESAADTAVEYFHWRRTANGMDLLDLENGVTPWVPTRWQRDRFPAEYRGDILVLFDGVDTHRFVRPRDRVRRLAGRTIPQDLRIVTFVARHLDRLRGFDRFVQLANALLRAEPDVLCIAAGGSPVQRALDVRYYGQDYAAAVLGQTPAHDPERFWLLGSVTPAGVAELLAASDLHVYPSRPYSVSRSLVEAMSAGCVVLAWDTEPVREFLTHGQTGLLVSVSDADSQLRQARAVLRDPAAHRPLGEAAAAHVRVRYSQEVTLPALARQFDRLVERGL